jgi:NADPH-dependent curcumin reductase
VLSNRQVVLAARPRGVAQAEHFAIVEAPAPRPAPGEILIRNLFLSVEPAMRGWIADKDNYAAPVSIGEVMRSLCVGEVIESQSDAYSSGEIVCGWFGWQELAAVAPAAILRRVLETDLPLSLALGVLGINGVTAYLALKQIGRPLEGETVVVSTAAGAVGSAAGQIATLLGARAIGIAGGPAKVERCVREFGFAEAVDYCEAGWPDRLARLCPNDVNVFFDNTSGAIADVVYPRLAVGARVVICGTAAIESWDPWPEGPRPERHLLVKRASAQGFVVFDHMGLWDSSISRLAEWVRNGELRYREDVLDGLDACPDALAGLYRGENQGKRIIRLSR